MTPDIHDIKGLVPLPLAWGWWLLLGAVLLAGMAGFWWWRRRRTTTATESPNAFGPPPSAYELALAALQQLQAENPVVDLFFTRLSGIVRQYLEGRFSLRAPERTTEEFLHEISQNGLLSPQHKDLLGAFLQECDLVKFARHQPGDADRQRAFAAAETFVRETVPMGVSEMPGRGRDAAPTRDGWTEPDRGRDAAPTRSFPP